MIIILDHISTAKDVDKVNKLLDTWKISFQQAYLYGKIIFGTQIDLTVSQQLELNSQVPVELIVPTSDSYNFVSSKWKNKPTLIDVKGSVIGEGNMQLIAGPCAVESEEQMYSTAEFLSKKGIKFLRGGAFKPRTSPYSFQGMGVEGLKLMRKVADTFHMKVVTEVIDLAVLDKVYQYADVLQVGSRNMHNYYFLRELGKIEKPVLLKRGMYARIEEWLLAAEYILSHGNGNVIMCERGIRSYDEAVRNTLDISAVPLIKQLSHLPVIVDPSQGTGKRELIKPMSLAAIAAGADGLMIEVHPSPEGALSDGYQSLSFNQFNGLIESVSNISEAMGKKLDLTENKPIFESN